MISRKLRTLKDELARVRQSSLARNAGWMLVGQGASVLLQAAYFILLARLLGVTEYGIFAGAFAFSAIAAPYSSLGSGLLFVRYVSSKAENFAAYWGHILLSTFMVGCILALALYLIAPHFLNPASASVVLMVALGNCVFTQLLIGMSQVFQAFEQLRMTAMLTLLVNLLRVLAVGAMAIMLRHATASQWAMASLVVSVLAPIVGFAIITRRFRLPKFAPSLFRLRTAEGIGFSFAGSTQSVYNDIDKTLLSHYGMNVANGIYTMAYRIVDLATIPITALDAAALPRYFRLSSEGFAAVKRLAGKLATRAMLIGFIAAASMFIAAPILPRIVGPTFGPAVQALRWLCLLPALRGIHQLTGSAITGLGYQRYRTAAQFFVAMLNLGLNVWLIPAYGWVGAAWASLATDGTLMLLNCQILRMLTARQFVAPAYNKLETSVAHHG